MNLEAAIESLNKDFDKAPDPEKLKVCELTISYYIKLKEINMLNFDNLLFKQPRLIEINSEIKAIQHQINELTKSKTDILTENNNLKSQINGKILNL